jgi:hypothetical protein
LYTWGAEAVIFFTVAASTPKDFSITALGMFVWKIWLAGKRKPGSCDVSVLKVMAVSLPTLSWKCCSPRGKRMTSPCCRVAAYRTLSSLMKPVYTEPLSTSSVSEARGWVWSGNTPPTAKSRRTWVTPCVLMPGHFCGVATMSDEPRDVWAIWSRGEAATTNSHHQQQSHMTMHTVIACNEMFCTM